MTESLSDDAQTVLSFIIDHPGADAKHIGMQFHIDWTRVYLALNELQDKGLKAGRTSFLEKDQVIRFYPTI